MVFKSLILFRWKDLLIYIWFIIWVLVIEVFIMGIILFNFVLNVLLSLKKLDI